MKEISRSIEDLFCKLEAISEEHDELTDTDVRESLHFALSYYFVWGNYPDTMPKNYGMLSARGDEAVSKAVSAFLRKVMSNPELESIPVGKERLNLLQDVSIRTPKGCHYDDFIGHVDEPLPPEKPPEDMYEDGFYE